MNKIWTSLIILSIGYGLINDNLENMINSIYLVLDDTLKLLFKISSGMIVWNGVLNILNKCDMLDKIAKPFRLFVKPLKLDEDEVVLNNLSIAFVINALGLGLASVPFMINALKNCKKSNQIKLLLFNLCPITLFPYTIISIRNEKTMIVWISIIIISLFMYISTIIYVNIARLNE